MIRFRLSITPHSFRYALNVFLGAMACWYGLSWVGAQNPVWAVITIILVSDYDLGSAITLSKVRSINTIVGCGISLISLTLFGYSPWGSFLSVMATILLINSIENYPANWRLAPVTVAIVMDATRDAVSYKEAILYALERAGQIGVGCVVALAIAFIDLKLMQLLAPKHENDPQI